MDTTEHKMQNASKLSERSLVCDWWFNILMTPRTVRGAEGQCIALRADRNEGKKMSGVSQ